MTTLDLTQEAQAYVPAAPVADDVDARTRASAIETWRGRMVNEHVSARVFETWDALLADADLPPARRAWAARMVEDERRHARQCAAMVLSLGGEARADICPLPAAPLYADASPLEAVLRHALSVSCLSETCAVALIDAERRKAGPSAMAHTLKTILADEVQHARFGWTLLEEQAAHLDARLRDRLGAYLTVAFAHLEAYELANLPTAPAPSARAEELGVCDGPSARALFFDTVDLVIIPKLEAHGLPARAAWEQRRAA